MATRIARKLARKPAMVERRARQNARTPGFTPIQRTRRTAFASQTVVVRVLA